MKGGTIVLILLLVLGFGGCAACGSYNGLVQSDESVKQSWANVQSAYQRRADLIPNLVATVKGAANFEKETLQGVIEARAKATSNNIKINPDDLNDPAKMKAYQEAQNSLGGAIGRLLSVAEAYPQLQATQSFRDLTTQLEGTENRINTERNRYNEVVNAYNVKVRSLPTSLFAGFMGFKARTPFEADRGAEHAPKVQF
jgi:LemA protein